MNEQGLLILIVDDEGAARKKIRSYLADEAGIAQISEAENGPAAVKAIKEKNPDLVFLDIQMPMMSGFEVIQTVGTERMPPVVFVTAYDQYAIAAFDMEAVDYLLKPFHQERFKKSFHRALQKMKTEHQAAIFQKIVDQFQVEKKYWQRIMIKSGPRYLFINTAEIDHFTAEGKYVRIHSGKGKYLLRKTMAEIEKNVDPTYFTRIHRSYIVNIDFIKEIQPWSHGDYLVIMQNGEKLPLSRRYGSHILEKK